MVNILVPTDFSTLSRVAVLYAVRIANRLNGTVTLLHVIDRQQSMRATVRMEGDIRDILGSIRDRLVNLIQEVTLESLPRKPIRFKISRGASFNDTILKESRRLRSGLIVMGTKGASGLRKTLIGSNTASVLGASHIPVLAVPGRAEFRSFRNVVYATDLKNLDEELDVLIPYIQRFNATIHIVHVLQPYEDVEAVEHRIERSIQRTGYRKFVTFVTIDHDIDSAIENYINLSRADLVAMFTHKPTFYERLLDRSVTRKMALHSKIPLLAFRQQTGNQQKAD